MSMPKKKFTLKQLLLVIAGCLCLFWGALGVVLPLVPTTPFVLLALWCFARSSERFHSWLLNHHYFGRVLSDWQQYRGMATRHKRRAYVLIVLSFAFSIYIVPWFWLKPVLLMTGCGVLWHIHHMPTVPERKAIDKANKSVGQHK